MESAAPERQPDRHAQTAPAVDAARVQQVPGMHRVGDAAAAVPRERIDAAAASFVQQANQAAAREDVRMGAHARVESDRPVNASAPARQAPDASASVHERVPANQQAVTPAASASAAPQATPQPSAAAPQATPQPAAAAPTTPSASQPAAHAPVDFWRYRAHATQQQGQQAQSAAQPRAGYPRVTHTRPAYPQAQPGAVPAQSATPPAASAGHAHSLGGAASQPSSHAPGSVPASPYAAPYAGQQPSQSQQTAPQQPVQRYAAYDYAQRSAIATREAAVRYAEQTLAAQGDASLRAQQVATMQGTHAAVEVAPRKSSALSGVLSFIIMLAIVVGMAWLMRTFVVSPYEIPSGSMEQTILSGDKVFSEKLSYYMHGINPGDIVTFDDPEVAGRTLIKRCVAVAGQTVDLQGGLVYVDGVVKDEPYTSGKPSEELTPAPGVEISYPYTVPEGHIWVMGDNRTNSADSRYFGAVPTTSVTGHAFCIYWPFDRMGLLN